MQGKGQGERGRIKLRTHRVSPRPRILYWKTQQLAMLDDNDNREIKYINLAKKLSADWQY